MASRTVIANEFMLVKIVKLLIHKFALVARKDLTVGEIGNVWKSCFVMFILILILAAVIPVDH
jgi:hypothetical protein